MVIQCLQALGHRVRGYTSPCDLGVQRGIPYLGDDHLLLQGGTKASVLLAMGIGKVGIDSPRFPLLQTYLSSGYSMPSIVGQHAVVHDDVHLGAGTVVLDGAVVVTGTQMGRACIVNTHATVDHDCDLGDDVHVAPGATLSGGVTVGSRCLIGTGARVIQGVTIVADCLVAAGATVVRNLEIPGTYMGTPARRVS